MANAAEKGFPRRPNWPWIVAILFLTAAALWQGPWSFTSPVVSARPVAAVSTQPVRSPKLRPEYSVGEFSYRCSDCHRHIPSPPETTRSLTQHREIDLRHGINTRCFNCHHRDNRDAFVDDWGREIPFDQPQLLCAKCHGTVYRDWVAGSHGRTNGYWDRTKGPLDRRRCIECHDPHHPPFGSLAPAPPPNTLRMGPQEPSPDEHESPNPLRLHPSSGERRPDPANRSATP